MLNKVAFLIYIFSILLLPYIMIGQNITNYLNLIPNPAKINVGREKFRLNENFTVGITNTGEKVHKASDRFLERLSKRTGLFFKFPYALIEGNHDEIDCSFEFSIESEINLGMKEGYTLIIDSRSIKLNANSDIGIIRGIETLLQSLSSDSSGYYFPELTIEDNPRFPWRGLLIDVSRHFMPLDVIIRNIDGMAAVKLNVLHLHLSDDQGFRVESKTFPRLHEMGSDGDFYTQEDVKKIIKYANDRGIRVVPEFDIPGHSTSWFVGYPEYASQPGPYEIERKFGIKDPTFNPTNMATYSFLNKFFKEMSELFNDDYMHIGGDENNGKHWDANDQIQAYMKDNQIEDNHELQAYFNKKILEILTKYDKQMIGWDEILHKEIPKNIVIQSWRGKKSLVDAAKQGYNGILSNGYYIDLMQPTEYHYLNDPIDETTDLTDSEKKRILGGEMTMWSEWVTKENIDSRIWPRAAAIAERFWSPRNIRDINDLFRRLDVISIQLEDLGLEHISFQEKMLRRLSNGMNTESLKLLVDCVEPLEEYERAQDARQKGFEYTQLTPYTRVIDASVVDSKFSIELKHEINEILGNFNEGKASSIRKKLSRLKINHEKLLPLINSNPILLEIKPLSHSLSMLADIGLEALEYHENKSSPQDKEWFIKTEKVVNKSKISFGQAEIVIVGPINSMIEALR